MNINEYNEIFAKIQELNAEALKIKEERDFYVSVLKEIGTLTLEGSSGNIDPKLFEKVLLANQALTKFA